MNFSKRIDFDGGGIFCFPNHFTVMRPVDCGYGLLSAHATMHCTQAGNQPSRIMPVIPFGSVLPAACGSRWLPSGPYGDRPRDKPADPDRGCLIAGRPPSRSGNSPIPPIPVSLCRRGTGAGRGARIITRSDFARDVSPGSTVAPTWLRDHRRAACRGFLQERRIHRGWSRLR